VKTCIAAILIAGLEKTVSGTAEVNMGGRLIDPNMVIASRNRKVAATVLGNLADGAEAGDFGKAEGPPPFATFTTLFSRVGFPYIWTKRTSFHTPRGTLTRHVAMKVMELMMTLSAPVTNAVLTLSTVLAVAYVAAYSVHM